MSYSKWQMDYSIFTKMYKDCTPKSERFIIVNHYQMFQLKEHAVHLRYYSGLSERKKKIFDLKNKLFYRYAEDKKTLPLPL